MEKSSVDSIPEFSKFAKNKGLASGGQARGETLPPVNTTETLMKDEKSEVSVSTKDVQDK